MTKRNETTGPAILTKAAAILAASKDFAPGQRFCVRRKRGKTFDLSLDDVVSFCASLTTQAPDQFTSRADVYKHLERETLRAGRLPKGHKRIKRHRPIARNHKARAAKRGKRN